MAAYTINTSLAQVLPDPAGRPPASDVFQAKLWTAVNRRGFPGQSTQDRFSQADNYVGAVYVAVQALMKGLSGASIKVLKRRSAGGGMTSQDASQNKDWTPAPSNHPLVQLFEHVNPIDTLMGFLGQYVMCRSLFGRVFVYTPPALDGKPCEMYCVRPQYMTPSYMANEHYPFGAWRLTLPTPYMYGFAQSGNVILDARNIVQDQLPHPKWAWDGYSPLTAGGLQLDALREVNEARKRAMEMGSSVEAVVTIAGASEPELERVQAMWSQRYTGSSKGAKVMFSGGEDVKATPLNIAPKDMGFDSGYEQLTNFCLSLFGVNPAMIGATETTSYAQLYAAIQQFRSLKLQPEANEIAAVWTKHLAQRHWGNDYRISIELPELLDPGVVEERRKAMVGNGSITVNEDRATANLEPLPDADLPASVYLQKLQQDMAPPPMPGMAGAEGLAPDGAIGGGVDEGDGEEAGGMAGEQPQDVEAGGDGGQAEGAMTDAVLQALGVQGGDEPGMVQKSRFRKGWTRFTTKTGGVGARNETTGREVYGAKAEAALAGGQPKPAGDLRHNPDLDEAFNPTPAVSQDAPKPATAPTTGQALTQMVQSATFPPQAKPVAQKAKVAIAKVVPKLKPVAESPAGQQALRDVAKWGRVVADKHADLIAASTGLDRAASRDLFLVILAHLVRSLPVVGGVASGVTAAVGAHLRNQDRKKVTGAVKEHGKASTQLENARKRAASLGVNPDEGGSSSIGPNGPPRPKNKAGAGSLPGRIGRKSLASVAIGYAKRVNKSLKQGV